VRDIERANSDIKNMQYEIKRVPKIKEIELNGKDLYTEYNNNFM
jgi:hypothetical protein